MPSDANALLEIEIPGATSDWTPVDFYGREALDTLFEYRLTVSTQKPIANVETLLGQTATVRLQSLTHDSRYFNGVITKINPETKVAQAYTHYQLVLQPWFYLLQMNQCSRQFFNQSAVQIIQSLLNDSAMAKYDVSRLSKKYSPINYKVQYQESVFHFLSRLMETHGIFYYFEHSATGHILTLGDSPQSYRQGSPISFDYQIPLSDGTEIKDVVKSVGAMTSYASQSMDGEIGQMSTVREQIKARSNRGSLAPGSVIQLANCPTEAVKSEQYLITALEHCIKAEHEAAASSHRALSYRNEMTAMPLRDRYYPPLGRTKRPNIANMQPAKVAGPKPGAIHVNPQGQIQVLFPWDKAKQPSKWIKVAQPWAGTKMGMQFFPRVGDEVAIQYFNGNPDDPIALTSLANGNNRPVFSVPANANKSGYQSHSIESDNRQANNQFILDDTPGQEQVVLHAQKDMNQTVEHSWLQTINGSENIQVTGDFITKILKGSHSTQAKEIVLEVGTNRLTISSAGIKMDAKQIQLLTDKDSDTQGAARLGDNHKCPKMVSTTPHQGGPVTQGSPNVIINGLNAAREGDPLHCLGSKDSVKIGSKGVFMNSKPAARLNSQTAHGGVVTAGSSDVMIGKRGAVPGPSETLEKMEECFHPTMELNLPDLGAVEKESVTGTSIVYILHLSLIGTLTLQDTNGCDISTFDEKGFRAKAKDALMANLEKTTINTDSTWQKAKISNNLSGSISFTSVESFGNKTVFTFSEQPIDMTKKDIHFTGDVGYKLEVETYNKPNVSPSPTAKTVSLTPGQEIKILNVIMLSISAAMMVKIAKWAIIFVPK